MPNRPAPDLTPANDTTPSQASKLGTRRGPTDRRRLLLVVKLVVLAVVGFFLCREVRGAWVELHADPDQRIDWSQVRYGYLTLAAGLYLVGMLPMGWYWHRLLNRFGHHPPLLATLRAFYVGHLGKYVPGKAMVVVLRTGLLARFGVPSTVAAVSIFAETLTMMSVGAFIAAATLSILYRQFPWLILLATGLMIGAGVPTLPPAFRFLVRKMKLSRLDPQIDQTLQAYTMRVVAYGWAANLVGWWLLGMSLWAVIVALPISPATVPLGVFLPRLTASVSLAVVAGFLSLLPGGVLVREFVLNQLLVQPFGRPTAVVSAILLRLIWLVSEAVISIILYKVRSSPIKANPPGVPPAATSSPPG